ncbi:5-hydroxytryptamine receptor 5B [Anoplophora glabripennis]|uniref:5-hydroxytryptamine receptor 5B n=1 Tax=Anoplophora glabripennis TaxID=217634 RepID=UPI000873B3F4|nr:5-hydroxytryptamine receptor 5B [Anoplophora glabripennis]XP_018563111.1 5-hydroxytryptamine receptor 5B [Anoplophora glabripennis]
MESDYHWLITIGLVTSSVIAVTANFFLLVVFCRRRGLRTVPNRFVINLLITNLLSSILLIPLLLVDQDARTPSQLTVQQNQTDVIIKEKSTNIEIIQTDQNILAHGLGLPSNTTTNRHLLCYFAQSTTSFVCTASIFSILLIGINQYFGVIHSLRYHFYINKCRSSIFIGISWFVALFCATLSSLTYSDSSLWHFCEERSQPSHTVKVLNTTYAFGYFFLVILAPFVAICVIYVCIYTAAHQNSERMRRSTSAPLNSYIDYMQVPLPKCREVKSQNSLPKVHSAPNFFNIEREESFKIENSDVESQKPRTKVVRTCSDRIAHSFINNLRHKISNASVFRYREETRAAKISVLVILMVLVCYIPYGLTLILSSECVKVNSSQIFNYLSLILLVFSNILSPFLFGYRNKRVKREICKMFGLLPKQRIPFGERPRRVAESGTVAEPQGADEPFIQKDCVVPEVIVTCKPESERKSILKRVCNSSSWASYKKCNFITVPDSCISGEARGSFSSASTQISTEE